MVHQYMFEIFHGPHKSPPAPLPTYLMYGPLSQTIQMIYIAVLFHRLVSNVKTLDQFFNNILPCFTGELMFVSYCIDLTSPGK